MLYCTKLKELKQKRILAKLKKINEKRRKYHSVSTEGKVPLSSSDNTVVNSRSTTVSSTNKNVEIYEQDQKDIEKVLPDRPEAPKVSSTTSDISENALMKGNVNEAITQNSIPSVNNPGKEGSDGPNSDNMTKVTGVVKLCGSPVKMNNAIKEEIHKLLQEEESRTNKVENVEQSSKSLKVQSNFKAGLLNLQSPDQQSIAGRGSSSSPISGHTLSTSSSSAVFTSPPVSKTVSKTSGVLEESDEDYDYDDNVSKELKMLNAIVTTKHEEELAAKKSRERMLKAYSVEKSSMATLGGAKKSLIDYATAEMSPMVWQGLIEERRKKWLANHCLWK